jgi:hypothetical protein
VHLRAAGREVLTPTGERGRPVSHAVNWLTPVHGVVEFREAVPVDHSWAATTITRVSIRRLEGTKQ